MEGKALKQYTYDVIVIGTGAAGYNAACRIRQLSDRSVAIVTEGVNCGTSRNTGSDKQTYYKLGLGGEAKDSVRCMAENLFAGGSVDGDNALCEAALSARCFLNLCELGVPFPVNRYGEYVGYKTDHDPYARATSAGPLTSKFMTEALERKAKELKIPVFDELLAVEILKAEEQVCGIVCLDQKTGEPVAFRCGDILLATGGPAGIYADSVYPQCHTGSTGLALLAGARTQNLTEWQYGLASVDPRWNVSGTYMQVLPRLVSVDADGTETEFLAEYFEDSYEALSTLFLKGYQWPFDSRKVLDGSSVIDLLVYRECVQKGRKVYLDYTKNPFGLAEIAYEKLSDECRNYLEKAEACFGTPIERLKKMNAPAVELYRSKGRDIETEYLEIALCAQHNNGGISVDLWWQTSIKGLFAAGECAGTHGVARPGGSALNAGQVGSLRAAMYISEHGNPCPEDTVFEAALAKTEQKLAHIFEVAGEAVDQAEFLRQWTKKAQIRMSHRAAAIRKKDGMEEAFRECMKEWQELESISGLQNCEERYLYFKLRDILVTQLAVQKAMVDYAHVVGATRGSALYYDEKGCLRRGLEEFFRFTREDGSSGRRIQEVWLTEQGFRVRWRDVRPLDPGEDFFENVWRAYREHKNIY